MAFRVTKEFRVGSMRAVPKTQAPSTVYLSLATDGTLASYGEASYVSAYAGLTNFTAEFWFKLTAFQGDWDRLFDHNQQTGFSITRNQGNNSIQFRTMDQAVNSTVLSFSNWIHVACVRNGSTGYIYINGALNSSGGINSNAFTNTQPIGIGQNRTNGNERVAGKFADVRLWNIARTGTQIANNYNTHLVGNESGLIANWKFIQGNTLADSSATNNPITVGANASFVSDVPY